MIKMSNYVSDAEIYKLRKSKRRRHRNAAKNAMEARAAEKEVIGPKRPSEDDVRQLLESAEPHEVDPFTSVWDWSVGNDQRTLPDGSHVWRNSNNVYSINGNSYKEPLETYNAISNGFAPRDTDTDDNGGLGTNFFIDKEKMEKQGEDIKQLLGQVNQGDPTANAAAQLLVGATGNVGQIGNNQPVGLIAHGGKRSRKYRKRNKKTKRRYRRASGKSKV